MSDRGISRFRPESDTRGFFFLLFLFRTVARKQAGLMHGLRKSGI